ncbi:MAG: hypothetical protein LBC17_04250 [Lactobacillaceae bacterium]|jgi:hypothetical protein|nr:hypothetical protein [Lactobacillaceae bacterium]
MAEENQIEQIINSLKEKLPKDVLEKLSPDELKENATELLKNTGKGVESLSDKLNLDDLVKNLKLDDLSDKAKDVFSGLFGGKDDDKK